MSILPTGLVLIFQWWCDAVIYLLFDVVQGEHVTWGEPLSDKDGLALVNPNALF